MSVGVDIVLLDDRVAAVVALLSEDDFMVEVVLLSTLLRTDVVCVFTAADVVAVVSACAVDVSALGTAVLPSVVCTFMITVTASDTV